MKTISSLFKRLALTSDDETSETIINPSKVLKVHEDDITGTLEIRSLNEGDDPSSVLRVSWIRRNDLHGKMETVWVNEEMEVL